MDLGMQVVPFDQTLHPLHEWFNRKDLFEFSSTKNVLQIDPGAYIILKSFVKIGFSSLYDDWANMIY